MTDNPLIPRPIRRGQAYPWLTLPDVQSFEAIQDFDRAACARGHKQFLRQLHPLEIQALPPEARAEVHAKRLNAILVTEVRPGIRTRHYLQAEYTLWS